jgi:5-formyltetrahydrofolate cyclo-ligase
VSTRFPDDMSADEIEAFRAAAKEALRKRMSQLRRALPEPARKQRSEALCALLREHPAFREASLVLAYSPLRFEASPLPLVEAAWAAGKTVALPRVQADTRSFSIHRYCEGDPLEESGHLILEPDATAPELALDDVTLVLVPGLAFDGAGQRLGFGQGYYDRMLPRMRNAVRVGLCFDLSLLPEVPHAAHDVPMHVVATDRRLLSVD